MRLYVVKAGFGGEVLTKPMAFIQCEHFIRQDDLNRFTPLVIVPVLDED